ncbi:unnamed protein product [Callosobruchus maculatus]|uniref:Uncharacterized protein n=1 Tax=Callosobruchus maculatus TaxID=64391 RepID=A0A653CP90_CALMS|nr:unnamed protein product [Callosobruchus maculatus]
MINKVISSYLFCSICAGDGLLAGSGWIICLTSSRRSLPTFCLSAGISPRLNACHASPFLGKGPPPRHSITVTPNANTSAFGSIEFSSSSSKPSS